MELTFSPPPAFLSLPGEPPDPWTRWQESFENYITALGLTLTLITRRSSACEEEELTAAIVIAVPLHLLCTFLEQGRQQTGTVP